MWKIYKVTGPTGRVYIGQTRRNVATRWREHTSGKQHTCKSIKEALDAWGPDLFVMEHVASCRNREDANLIEQYLIVVHSAMHYENGYNRTAGGVGRGWYFCPYGHEYAVTGQNEDTGRCDACELDRSRARRAEHTPEQKKYHHDATIAWQKKQRDKDPVAWAAKQKVSQDKGRAERNIRRKATRAANPAETRAIWQAENKIRWAKNKAKQAALPQPRLLFNLLPQTTG